MLDTVKRLIRDEEGQGMAEYALILVLVAIAAIGAWSLLGEKIGDKVTEVGEEIGGTGSAGGEG